MKCISCLVAVFLVAVQAFPNDMIKLDPDTAGNSLNDAIPAVFSTTAAAATLKAYTTSTEEASSSEPKKFKSQGTAADRTKLVNDLFRKYDKRVEPDHVNVGFGVNLLDFKVLECEHVLETHLWLRQDWNDARLKWNPEEYGGTELIRVEESLVWKPDVVLYNSADYGHMHECWNSNVLLYSNGNVLWVPPCKLTSTCQFAKLKEEPYGETKCSLKFGSWTFDQNSLDLHFHKNNASMAISHSENMWKSGFEIVENVAVRNEKYYSCCKEGYPDLTYNLTLKRIPGGELFKQM